jgi:hypothetical protein
MAKKDEQGTLTLTSKPTPIEFDRDDFTINDDGPNPEIPIPNTDTRKEGSPESEKRLDFESDELREHSTDRPVFAEKAEEREIERQGSEVKDESVKQATGLSGRSLAGKKAAATKKENEVKAKRSAAAKKAAATRKKNEKKVSKKK